MLAVHDESLHRLQDLVNTGQIPELSFEYGDVVNVFGSHDNQILFIKFPQHSVQMKSLFSEPPMHHMSAFVHCRMQSVVYVMPQPLIGSISL